MLLGIKKQRQSKLPKRLLFLVALLTCCLIKLLIPTATYAANTYAMSDTSNFNIRFDGDVADAMLGHAVSTADLDSDGNTDLLISAPWAGASTGDGYVYVIYDELLATLGNTVDLADSSNYNIRYTTDVGQPGESLIGVADLDNDDKEDILIGAYDTFYNAADDGSLYVIYNTLIDDYTGTGNTVDLSTDTNYNLRYVGATDHAHFARIFKIADVDNDDKQDIIIGSWGTDYNGRATSGSAYVIYNTLIDNYSGTGNVIELGTAANFNLRYDGPSASAFFPGGAISCADLNGNGKNDLLLKNYIIYDSLIDDYPGTANTINMSTNTNYNLSYTGITIQTAGDLDGDGNQDIYGRCNSCDYNSRNNSGSLFVIYNTLIDDYAGTANDIDPTSSTNYNLRFDGANAGDELDDIPAELFEPDFNHDGKTDILVGASGFNSYAGALYMIYNNFDAYSGTGNNIDLNDSSNYAARYDGPASGVFFTTRIASADLNNDNRADILVSANYTDYNGRDTSGSIYLIYNFPHSFSVSAPFNYTNGGISNQMGFSASLSASNSVTNIKGVNYSIDNTSFGGTWNNCSASDGSFDSTEEEFRCDNIDLSDIAEGHHVLYTRAYDDNISYTASSSYGSFEFLVDRTNPQDFTLIGP